jgi:hypothetical protein
MTRTTTRLFWLAHLSSRENCWRSCCAKRVDDDGNDNDHGGTHERPSISIRVPISSPSGPGRQPTDTTGSVYNPTPDFLSPRNYKEYESDETILATRECPKALSLSLEYTSSEPPNLFGCFCSRSRMRGGGGGPGRIVVGGPLFHPSPKNGAPFAHLSTEYISILRYADREKTILVACWLAGWLRRHCCTLLVCVTE